MQRFVNNPDYIVEDMTEDFFMTYESNDQEEEK